MKIISWLRSLVQVFNVAFAGVETEEGLGEEANALATYELTRETIPAPGWSAILEIENNQIEYPLVAWDVTFKDDEPFEMVGLVFCNNKPPFVEKASSNPNFVAYKHSYAANVSEDGSPAPVAPANLINAAYQEFGEWN